jgi:hypothetical protein
LAPGRPRRRCAGGAARRQVGRAGLARRRGVHGALEPKGARAALLHGCTVLSAMQEGKLTRPSAPWPRAVQKDFGALPTKGVPRSQIIDLQAPKRVSSSIFSSNAGKIVASVGPSTTEALRGRRCAILCRRTRRHPRARVRVRRRGAGSPVRAFTLSLMADHIFFFFFFYVFSSA